jgi:hypothetical protein
LLQAVERQQHDEPVYRGETEGPSGEGRAGHWGIISER